MAIIELDESWETYDQEEQKRLEEMFPVIEVPMVKAQLTSWDMVDVGKLGMCVVVEFTIIEDPQYAGKTLKKPLPLGGRMKFITKRFMDSLDLARKGKSIDPEPWMGKLANLHLSVAVGESGRKLTRIDAVSAA